MKFAYVRVSAADQNPARQLEGLPKVDRIYEEKISGKDADRPQLQAMLANLRDGDEVFVHDMTRLGRSLLDLLNLTEQIIQNGCSLHFVKEKLAFTASNKDDPFLQLQYRMLAMFAEFERAINKQRQIEGIALAKQRGVYKGGKKKLSKADAEKLRADLAAGLTIKLIQRKYGVSRASVYNYGKGVMRPAPPPKPIGFGSLNRKAAKKQNAARA
jgi:DNA invertase Pin-like site-specific DNA recombinase